MANDHHPQARSALHNLLLRLVVRSIKPGHLVCGVKVVGEEMGEARRAALLEQAEDKVSRKVANKMKIFQRRFWGAENMRFLPNGWFLGNCL